MALSRKLLQTTKYKYIWNRDNGDGDYAGKLDRIKVDKDEGYEVLYFIEAFLKSFKLEVSDQNVHLVEDALHADELSAIVMRDELKSKIAKSLNLV